ncbi:hypothetical protein BKA80DRAFT_282594 [Phyllosticta citrichinensis]
MALRRKRLAADRVHGALGSRKTDFGTAEVLLLPYRLLQVAGPWPCPAVPYLCHQDRSTQGEEARACQVEHLFLSAEILLFLAAGILLFLLRAKDRRTAVVRLLDQTASFHLSPGASTAGHIGRAVVLALAGPRRSIFRDSDPRFLCSNF